MPDNAFITQPPADVAGWAALFDPAALPVLATTLAEVDDLRLNEDAVDARWIASAVGGDPLMVLKLLTHVARQRRGDDDRSDPETATEALVMLGIGPFFREFQALQSVQTQIDGQALDGFEAVLRRAHRAARFAVAFAAHRMDHDAAVIHEAALLHDFTEMLLWLRAPALAMAIQARQRQQPTLRTAEVQTELLHIDLIDLQQALMRLWRLPPLLVRISDDRHASDGQVRNVVLAMRVARHSARGWDNPALPDDVDEIAELLQLGVEPTLRLLREIDDA
jgi:hypothetical protein